MLRTKQSHVLSTQEGGSETHGQTQGFSFQLCVCTDWQHSRGKSSLYRRPVRSVVIILTRTELMCLEPIRRIRAITLVNTCR